MAKIDSFLKVKRCIENHKGVTLVELLAVIVIMSILAAIAIPSYFRYVEKAEREVCLANSLELENMYQGYLELEGVNHTKVLFIEYMNQHFQVICPSGGDITYVEGNVTCSIHPKEEEMDDHDEEDSDVPYL